MAALRTPSRLLPEETAGDRLRTEPRQHFGAASPWAGWGWDAAKEQRGSALKELRGESTRDWQTPGEYSQEWVRRFQGKESEYQLHIEEFSRKSLGFDPWKGPWSWFSEPWKKWRHTFNEADAGTAVADLGGRDGNAQTSGQAGIGLLLSTGEATG